MDDQDQKDLIKQAIKEWMDEQYSKFGRFIVGKILFALLVSFIAWYVTSHGVKFP